jgi:hypothetical protein
MLLRNFISPPFPSGKKAEGFPAGHQCPELFLTMKPNAFYCEYFLEISGLAR